MAKVLKAPKVRALGERHLEGFATHPLPRTNEFAGL